MADKKTKFGRFVDGVVEGGDKFFDKVTELPGDVANAAEGAWDSAGRDLRRTAKSVGDTTQGWVSGVNRSVIQPVDKAGRNAFSFLAANPTLVSPALGSIKDAVDSFSEAVATGSEASDKVVDYLKRSNALLFPKVRDNLIASGVPADQLNQRVWETMAGMQGKILTDPNWAAAHAANLDIETQKLKEFRAAVEANKTAVEAYNKIPGVTPMEVPNVEQKLATVVQSYSAADGRRGPMHADIDKVTGEWRANTAAFDAVNRKQAKSESVDGVTVNSREADVTPPLVINGVPVAGAATTIQISMSGAAAPASIAEIVLNDKRQVLGVISSDKTGKREFIPAESGQPAPANAAEMVAAVKKAQELKSTTALATAASGPLVPSTVNIDGITVTTQEFDVRGKGYQQGDVTVPEAASVINVTTQEGPFANSNTTQILLDKNRNIIGAVAADVNGNPKFVHPIDFGARGDTTAPRDAATLLAMTTKANEVALPPGAVDTVVTNEKGEVIATVKGDESGYVVTPKPGAASVVVNTDTGEVAIGDETVVLPKKENGKTAAIEIDTSESPDTKVGRFGSDNGVEKVTYSSGAKVDAPAGVAVTDKDGKLNAEWLKTLPEPQLQNAYLRAAYEATLASANPDTRALAAGGFDEYKKNFAAALDGKKKDDLIFNIVDLSGRVTSDPAAVSRIANAGTVDTLALAPVPADLNGPGGTGPATAGAAVVVVDGAYQTAPTDVIKQLPDGQAIALANQARLAATGSADGAPADKDAAVAQLEQNWTKLSQDQKKILSGQVDKFAAAKGATPQPTMPGIPSIPADPEVPAAPPLTMTPPAPLPTTPEVAPAPVDVAARRAAEEAATPPSEEMLKKLSPADLKGWASYVHHVNTGEAVLPDNADPIATIQSGWTTDKMKPYQVDVSARIKAEVAAAEAQAAAAAVAAAAAEGVTAPAAVVTPAPAKPVIPPMPTDLGLGENSGLDPLEVNKGSTAVVTPPPAKAAPVILPDSALNGAEPDANTVRDPNMGRTKPKGTPAVEPIDPMLIPGADGNPVFERAPVADPSKVTFPSAGPWLGKDKDPVPAKPAVAPEPRPKPQHLATLMSGAGAASPSKVSCYNCVPTENNIGYESNHTFMQTKNAALDSTYNVGHGKDFYVDMKESAAGTVEEGGTIKGGRTIRVNGTGTVKVTIDEETLKDPKTSVRTGVSYAGDPDKNAKYTQIITKDGVLFIQEKNGKPVEFAVVDKDGRPQPPTQYGNVDTTNFPHTLDVKYTVSAKDVQAAKEKDLAAGLSLSAGGFRVAGIGGTGPVAPSTAGVGGGVDPTQRTM